MDMTLTVEGTISPAKVFFQPSWLMVIKLGISTTS